MPRRLGSPSASFCFGREQACAEILTSATESGAVLLFGGRQAGKTTVLLRIKETLRLSPSTLTGSPLIVAVSVDLLMLPHSESASNVFKFMLNQAIEAFSLVLPAEFLNTLLPQDCESCLLETFIAGLAEMVNALGRSDVYLLFLIDETKRILGREYSRGFQDNLFSLIWGEHVLAGRISVVFAGAQELFELSVDETSPIGSRAAIHLLENLGRNAVDEMVRHFEEGANAKEGTCATEVYKLTGGQPGLSLRVIARCSEISGLNQTEKNAFLHKRAASLFQVWLFALSPEAQVVQENLLRTKVLPIESIGRMLHAADLDRYKASRACDELIFTGVAQKTHEGLVLVNELYAAFLETFFSHEYSSLEEKNAWIAVETVELKLRGIVRKAYSDRWGVKADEQIESVLGAQSWATLKVNREKSAKSYRYTAHLADTDLLHYAYFGQLTQLMLSRGAWDLFQVRFRDKRELEDIVKDVMPVRNDSAHFRSVPERELQRCLLRCGDLLHLLR